MATDENKRHQQQHTVSLADKIAHRNAQVAVLGLGYVGLPMSVHLAEAGFNVVGIDIDSRRVEAIKRGELPTSDVTGERVTKVAENGLFSPTDDTSAIGSADIVLICVPTPVNKSKEPDLTCIRSATDAIASHLRQGQLIILESTTYPGTTEEIILPRLEQTGMRVGRDFYLAFSPERLDPGNRRFALREIPKVVGGITEDCAAVASLFYQQMTDKVVRVSSATTAEMVKIYENVFRNINIAFANEVALLCDRMGLDVWEVIEAAATKPYGFMPFCPGPGLGGHCIPIDPYYLAWKARQYDFHVRFIELAASINDSMPYYVLTKISHALNKARKSLNGSQILLLGVTYKRDVADTRESPAFKIIDLLVESDANVRYADPYIPELHTPAGHRLRSEVVDAQLLREIDCAVIVTDHTNSDYSALIRSGKPVVDTRNAVKHESPLIVRL